jgi:hypothetical protein
LGKIKDQVLLSFKPELEQVILPFKIIKRVAEKKATKDSVGFTQKDMDALYGGMESYDPKTNTIIIDPELTGWPRLQTIFHEIFHVWEMTMNQCLTEQQVDTMASAMIHCLRENPELIKMIEDIE